MNMPFRVRHQSKYIARSITDSGNIHFRAVWIYGTTQNSIAGCPSFITVAQSQLSVAFQIIHRRCVACQEPSFGMGHWQVHSVDAGQERGLIARHLQVNPSILKSALGIPCQSSRWATLRRVKEYPKSHHDLETIAYSQHKSIFSPKAFDHIRQMRFDLCRQDSSSSDIVSIAETARKTEYLEIICKAWSFN